MEKFNGSGERHQPKPEIEQLAAERLKHLEASHEKSADRKESVEAAREKLQQVEKHTARREREHKPETTSPRQVLTKAVNYRQTMVSLQHRMGPAARSFSKIIHSQPVEATSEALAKTIMRPSVSLGATICAVVMTGTLYLYARVQGFVLHGSEIWISLIAGAIIGLLLEALSKAIRRASGRL